MIIEAGYDLGMRLTPFLARRRNRRALWIIAMDDQLRELFIDQVSPKFAGSVGAHIDDLRDILSPDREHPPAKYFALAHGIGKLRVNDPHRGIVDRDDQLVHESPELIDYRYLGRMVYDGEWIFTTWPRYSFRDYIGFEDLPRTAIFAGPHGTACECPACEQLYARWKGRVGE